MGPHTVAINQQQSIVAVKCLMAVGSINAHMIFNFDRSKVYCAPSETVIFFLHLFLQLAKHCAMRVNQQTQLMNLPDE